MTRLPPEAQARREGRTFTRRDVLKAATLGAIGLTVPLPVLRGIPVERAQSLAIVPEWTQGIVKATAYVTYSQELVYDDLEWFLPMFLDGGVSGGADKTWTFTPEVA